MPTSVTQMLSASILLAAITVCVTQATVAMDSSVLVRIYVRLLAIHHARKKIDVDECQTDPCINSDCENTNGSYICHCLESFFRSIEAPLTSPCGEQILAVCEI